MTINKKDSDLQQSLNRGNPNTIADAFRVLGFGDLLQQSLVHTLRRKVPAADVYNLATLLAVGLKEDARARVVSRAYARAGGVTGELTTVAFGTTPTTGQIAVSPNGDIVTLASDAITDLDVDYAVERGDVVEVTLPVVSNAIALPTTITTPGAVLLIEAEALLGTVTGKKIVLTPSASAAATGQARLDVAKANVKFNSGDAVTSARVKLLVASKLDFDALMKTDAKIY